jgi:hypothetical protein
MSETTITFFGVPEWFEQGPGPVVDGNGAFIGTGAVVALATHPAQAGVVYAATSGGGVWRSLDAEVGTATPDWQPLTDQYPSTALGAITLSHRDPSTVYAGTGTFASFEPSGGAVGLFRSSDGGATWEVTGADKLYGIIIRSLATSAVPDSGNEALLVAALNGYLNGISGGIFRSEDGGTTLTPLSAPAGTVLPAGEGWALAADPALPGRVYAAIGSPPPTGNAIYRSDDGGKTWTPTIAGIDATRLGSASWIRLAVAAGRVYTGLISGGQLVGLFTATSGATAEQWSEIPLPRGTSNAVNPLSEGKWKFAMEAAAGSLYVGGDGGGIWRCDLSDPSAPRWERLSKLVGVTGDTVPSDSASLQKLNVHDDCQHLAIDAAGDLLAATDGGVYRLVNPARDPQRGARQWYAIAAKMRNNEAFSVGYDTLNRIAVVGTADNGCAEQTQQGSRTWLLIQDALLEEGGDGGGVAVDNSDPGVTLRYSMSNTAGAGLETIWRRSYDHTNHLTKSENILLAKPETPDVNYSALRTSDRSHSGYFALNNLQGEGSRMLVGGDGLYESIDGGATALEIPLTDPSSKPHTGVLAMAYGAMQDGVPQPDVAYVGLGDGTLWLRPPGGSFQQVNSYRGGVIAKVVMDLQDWKRAYVLDNANVWLTEDGGASTNWLDCTGNLLGIVADAQHGTLMQTMQIIPQSVGGGEAVLVCAAGGVFRSLNARTDQGAMWTLFGRNLPATYGHDVQYYPPASRSNGLVGDVLVASLYGRGAWVLEQASRDLFNPAEMQITSSAGPNTIRLARNRFVPALLEVFAPDGSTVPTTTVPLIALSRITIVCHGTGNRVTLDCSNGLIFVLDGIVVMGDPGVGTTLALTGGQANQQSILLGPSATGSVSVDGMQVRYEGIGSIASDIATRQTVIETETTPTTRSLSNGNPINGAQGLQLFEASNTGQFTVTVTRTDDVTLDLRKGSGRLDIDGLWGAPMNLRHLTVLTGPTQDVRIITTPEAVPVEVRGGGGTGTVGSVTIGSTTGSGGSLAAVRGPVQVSNAGGQTQLIVSAFLDPASTTAELASGSLSGLGPATISFAPSDLASLTVLGSAGGTTFTVEDTIPTGTTTLFGGVAPNALLGGGSINSLQVRGTSGPLDYTTGNGVDMVSLGAPTPNGSRVAPIQGPVTIQCLAQGNVNVTIDDSGETAAKDVGITATGVLGLTTAAITLDGGANAPNGLQIRSGRGQVFYSIVDTPPTFTVGLHGQGSDIVNVNATRQSLAIDGATAVTLGNQLMGLTLLKADVRVGANPGGTTQLTLDDRGNPHPVSMEIDSSAVRGLSAAALDFSAATLRDLGVLCGNGDNQVRVSNTPSSASTFIGLGTAPDHVDVLAISGPLVINAPADVSHKVIVGSTAPDVQKDELATIKGTIKIEGAPDTVDLVVSDARGLGQHDAALTSQEITGLAPDSLTYEPLHSLDLRLGPSGNVLRVSGIVLPGGASAHCGGHDRVGVIVSGTAPSDLLVVGGPVGEDTLEVIAEGGGQVQATPEQPSTPGVVRVTYPNGTSSVIQHQGIRHVLS